MISISQSKTALVPSKTASFLAVGGVEPYVYSVELGGAGGSIDPDTGVYTAPAGLSLDPKLSIDTIVATDSDGETAEAKIMVGHPLRLLCEIIQVDMGLPPGRVRLYNQRLFEPKDDGLYVIVSVVDDKPFANVKRAQNSSSGLDAEQYVSVVSTIGIDVISRSTEALNRRFDVLFALHSNYSDTQQTANGFSIARLPPSSRFVNLSTLDGPAIPYRFHIDVNMTYSVSRSVPIPFFDQFPLLETVVTP